MEDTLFGLLLPSHVMVATLDLDPAQAPAQALGVKELGLKALQNATRIVNN